MLSRGKARANGRAGLAVEKKLKSKHKVKAGQALGRIQKPNTFQVITKSTKVVANLSTSQKQVLCSRSHNRKTGQIIK